MYCRCCRSCRARLGKLAARPSIPCCVSELCSLLETTGIMLVIDEAQRIFGCSMLCRPSFVYFLAKFYFRNPCSVMTGPRKKSARFFSISVTCCDSMLRQVQAQCHHVSPNRSGSLRLMLELSFRPASPATILRVHYPPLMRRIPATSTI